MPVWCADHEMPGARAPTRCPFKPNALKEMMEASAQLPLKWHNEVCLRYV